MNGYGLLIKVVAILGVMFWIYDLYGDLEKANLTIEAGKLDKARMTIVIDQQTDSIDNLATTIDTLNEKYIKYERSYNDAKKSLAVWRAKAEKSKYLDIKAMTKVSTDDTCSYGLELNKTIAGINYAEL